LRSGVSGRGVVKYICRDGSLLVEKLELQITACGGRIMKKSKSTGYYILAIAWILVSLVWFFWVKNIPIGCIWLAVGIFELIIATCVRKKEKK
jgi:ABC-type branched-subunit amino acid transport system permease subunit